MYTQKKRTANFLILYRTFADIEVYEYFNDSNNYYMDVRKLILP